MSTEHPHLGRNIKRLREILGMKQVTLALEMGGDWNQKKISLLEGKDMIERPILEQVAKVLNLPVDFIENFDENATVLNVQNNYDGSNTNASVSQTNSRDNNYHECSFNPIDKIVELYERMIQDKNEMIEKLEKLMKEK